MDMSCSILEIKAASLLPPPLLLFAAPGAAIKSSFLDNSNKPPSLVDTWVLPSAGENISPVFLALEFIYPIPAAIAVPAKIGPIRGIPPKAFQAPCIILKTPKAKLLAYIIPNIGRITFKAGFIALNPSTANPIKPEIAWNAGRSISTIGVIRAIIGSAKDIKICWILAVIFSIFSAVETDSSWFFNDSFAISLPASSADTPLALKSLYSFWALAMSVTSPP